MHGPFVLAPPAAAGQAAADDDRADSGFFSHAWLFELLANLASERDAPSLLDLRCGQGERLRLAGGRGWQVFGVEARAQDRAAARAAVPGAYVAASVEEIPPHRFDLILLLGGIEEQADPYALFHELAAKGAIAPDTVVIATTPNARADALVRDPTLWLGQTSPRAIGFYSATALAELFRFLRFTRVEVAGADPDGDTPADRLSLGNFRTLWCRASGSDFTQFMQERYVPGTWSEISAYEHVPRYAYARSFAQGKRVLDFGCGSGYGSAVLADVAQSVIGLDISEGALAYASGRHRASALSFVHSDDFGASLPDGGFDLIVCFEVVEHVGEAAQIELLTAFRRLLSPGGHLLISTPNPAVTALYGANPYHILELTCSEFESRLKAHFPHVEVLAQSIHATVFLRPIRVSITDEQFRVVSETAKVPEPVVYVAVCGDTPIDALGGTIFPDLDRNYVAMRVEALHRRDQQLIERFGRVQLGAGVGRVRADLQRSDAARLAAEERARGLADREQHLSDLLTEATGRETQLADQCARLSVLLTEATERETQLADQSAHLSALLTEATERATQLADQSARLSAELAAAAGQEARLSNRLREVEEDRTHLEGVVADAEARIAETSRSLAHATSDLSQARQREEEAWAALVEARNQAAYFHSACDTASYWLRQREHELRAIELSTSWRAVQRAAPLLRRLRPIVRPILRTTYRLARHVRAGSAVAERGPPAAVEPPSQSDDNPPAPPPSPRHLAFETRLDPIWNPTTAAFDLHYDMTPAARSSSAGAGPYVVRPLTPIDPTVRRPKILHIIPNVYVGGSTQLVVDIVQHLSDRFEHEVLTSALWPGGAHVGLVVHHVPQSVASDMAEVIARVRPDMIHVHYWGLGDTPWYEAAFLALAGRDLPVIENINTPVAPLADGNVQAYVFVSKYVRDVFGADILGRAPTRVIYPGIDLGLFETPISDPDAGNAIGMVYRLEDDKLNEDAIDLFIEVVRRRPRTKVYIIGGGRFLLPYLERTEAARVRENFRFTGYVPYESLPIWYDKFAIFVAPVWKESFGQVAPFAMSKGGVVAGYAIGALPEILDGSDTLGATPEEAASIIVDLLGDLPRTQGIGRRNRERARSMFDVRAMIASYAELYDQVLTQAAAWSAGAAD